MRFALPHMQPPWLTTKEACAKRSTRSATTCSTVERSTRTRHMHDTHSAHTHYVLCTVVPFSSRLHFPPTTFSSPGRCAQSPFVQSVYRAAGCSSCCARPRDSDAHLSPRAKRNSVATCTTAYAHRARCTYTCMARALCATAHVASLAHNQGGMCQP